MIMLVVELVRLSVSKGVSVALEYEILEAVNDISHGLQRLYGGNLTTQ